MSERRRIAVTGATGFVGQTVIEEAVRRGITVRALTRRAQAPRGGVDWVEGSLEDRDALVRLVRDTDAVLHVAGLTKARDAAAFRRANVEGTRNVLRACEDAGVKRLVLVSSLSAREPRLSDYGASKLAAEELVRESALAWTIVRPPAVYGPRDTEMFELFRAARLGIVPLPPPGRASMIAVEDLARLLLDLTSAEQAIGALFEPDDGHPGGYSHAELAGLLGQAMGRRARGVHLPAVLLRAAARMDGALRGDAAKLTPDRVGYMTHPDWVCDPARAVPEPIWQPRIAAEDGFAATARWYREEGWL